MADTPVEFLRRGAIVQTLKVPPSNLNIVQGFATDEQYVAYNGPYFGETIGRVANRISDAKLKSLNGGQWPLAANNGPNNLHGGINGWGKQLWEESKPAGIKTIPGIEGVGDVEGETVVFKLKSPHLDEGFPGEVDAKAFYTVVKKVVEGKEVLILGIEYEAELVGGAEETAINMTNHR